jgi:DNA-binding PadR family transcriptional regulator
LRKNKKINLLRRGNITLIRLLIAVNQAGPKGISTMKLFRELGTTGYGQSTLSRAVKEGLIERETGEVEHGHFPRVYNRITPKGRQVLQSQLIGGERRR